MNDALTETAVPFGWIMLPRELTPEMYDALIGAEAWPQKRWDALLAAAPQAPVADAARAANAGIIAAAEAELAKKDRQIAFLRGQNRQIIEAAERIRSDARAASQAAAPAAEGNCTPITGDRQPYEWRDTGALETGDGE